tara:strand:- start:3591 stop:3815 length:225 start_codon:yes stop_codon:yes gene_type:complete
LDTKHDEKHFLNDPPVGLAQIKNGFGVQGVLQEAAMVLHDGVPAKDVLPALTSLQAILENERLLLQTFIARLEE